MRTCPRCGTGMRAARKTFAEIDVCPKCKGTFMDRGEGVATVGAAAELDFLVRDGLAVLVGEGDVRCPARHEPATMQLYAVGIGEERVEIDACPTCGGFFLDDGEAELLEALGEREAGEQVVTASGARFSAPPVLEASADAVSQAQEERGHDLFITFASDLLRMLGKGAVQGRRHHRRHRKPLF